MNSRSTSWSQERIDDLLTRGIAAVKAGEHQEARNFLQAAAKAAPLDARPWVWLSTTTEDPDERRHFLEEAIAIDPKNGAARRGLIALSGRVPQEEMLTPGATVVTQTPAEPVRATIRSFNCPNCGGLQKFDPRTGGMRCERCGAISVIERNNVASDRHEQGLDFVLPTARAHRWSAASHALCCNSCGATSVLPPDTLTAACAFCGSDQLISSSETAQLLEPQGIIPMQLEEKDAYDHARKWFRSGFFTPRDLSRLAHSLTLRPAYYPIWTFDATYNARWIAMVRVSNDRWERRDGERTLFFDDLLIPGTTKLTVDEVGSVAPFVLKQLVDFKEEFLVGWPAILYDQSLADASVAARAEMARLARDMIEERVLPDKETKDFKVIPQGVSDQTYRQLMLPLWVGLYTYKGKEYHVLVNGQTGKAGGSKPKSPIKVGMAVVAGTILAVIALTLYLFLQYARYSVF